jgi:hypothetical protein
MGYTNMLTQTLCRLASPCPSHLPFPSYRNVAQVRSYFASTVNVITNLMCVVVIY